MKMSRLLSGPVGCPRSRQDFLYFCLFGRKTSLQIRLQKMKPVISPENFAVHYETRNSKYSGLNGTLRLKTKPLLDFVGVGLAQSSLTPRRIEKPHGKSRPLSSGRAARCRWRAASAVSSSSRQTNTGPRGDRCCSIFSMRLSSPVRFLMGTAPPQSWLAARVNSHTSS
jgi:hypothetical protein